MQYHPYVVIATKINLTYATTTVAMSELKITQASYYCELNGSNLNSKSITGYVVLIIAYYNHPLAYTPGHFFFYCVQCWKK